MLHMSGQSCAANPACCPLPWYLPIPCTRGQFSRSLSTCPFPCPHHTFYHQQPFGHCLHCSHSSSTGCLFTGGCRIHSILPGAAWGAAVVTDHWLGPRAASLRADLPSLPDLPVSSSRASSPGSWPDAVPGLPWEQQTPLLCRAQLMGELGATAGLQQLGCAASSTPDLPPGRSCRAPGTGSWGHLGRGDWCDLIWTWKMASLGQARLVKGGSNAC